MRLGVLHALRELGVRCGTTPRAIERCVDKSMTSFLLARAGIPTPRPGRRIARGGARDRAARGGARPAGAQAAVRLAGERPAADPATRMNCPTPPRSPASTTCSASWASSGEGFRDFRLFVVAGPRHRRDGAPCRRAGSPTSSAAAVRSRPWRRRRAERPCRARRRGGRRGVRRRRHSRTAPTAPDGARGQQHAGLGRGCRRWHRPISRPLADALAAALPRRQRQETRPGAAPGNRMMAHAARIAAAFVAACRDELDAPKPGNVHVFADGHRHDGGGVRSAARSRSGRR